MKTELNTDDGLDQLGGSCIVFVCGRTPAPAQRDKGDAFGGGGSRKCCSGGRRGYAVPSTGAGAGVKRLGEENAEYGFGPGACNEPFAAPTELVPSTACKRSSSYHSSIVLLYIVYNV